MPSSGDLLNPGVEPASSGSPEFVGEFFTISTNWEIQEKSVRDT